MWEPLTLDEEPEFEEDLIASTNEVIYSKLGHRVLPDRLTNLHFAQRPNYGYVEDTLPCQDDYSDSLFDDLDLDIPGMLEELDLPNLDEEVFVG